MKKHIDLNHIILILFGNTVYALAVTLFIMPNGLITGGTTGLALLFNHQLSVPVSLFVSIFNVLMFLLGAVVLGKKFALTTLLSSFYYPAALAFFEKLLSGVRLTDDTLLATLFAGLMIGFAIGIVIKAGASTGGMDIPPLVLNKKFGFPVSVVMYILDFTILISQMLFADKSQVLYGILLVLTYTIVLDKVLLTGKAQTQVKIISKAYSQINEAIAAQLDRGCTLVHSHTGYLHEEYPIVLTIITNREFPKLNQIVQNIDPKAFMIINRVNEVRGRGFTDRKVYK